MRGSLSEAALRQATAWLLQRYPVLASRVVPLSGSLDRARRFAWELDEAPDTGKAFQIADLRQLAPEHRQRAEQALVDRFLDLGTQYPFALTWVRLPNESGQERSALFLQQHHGLADGRAFLELCRDLVRFIDCAQHGEALPPAEYPFARLPELSAVPGAGLARVGAYLRGFGHTFFETARNLLFRVAPLRCNLGEDYTGANRTRFVLVPEARLFAWRGERHRLGLSSNDLLSAALSAALGRWSARHGAAPGRTKLMVPLDTRPRERPFFSFANHLSSFLLTFDLGRTPKIIELAQQIARQASYQRRHGLPLKKLLIETPMAQALSIATLRKMVFDRPKVLANYSFSNLIPLGTPGASADGKWHGRDFEIDAMRITTPCAPPQGANTTVVSYGGTLCFNFNYKDSVIDAALADDLGASFEEALAELDSALLGRRAA